MPAAKAAFEVNAAQSAHENEQDFSAVILQMEERALLDVSSKGRTRMVGLSEKSI
jgi:hypothetical protein